ncbi:hypothetical protein RF11_12426 [Thelohanellus kitauei]|uniref:Uncharacterized protein n=1 Tax=Thelohanellus kitauei TaxID=669202 RepID=A0A0C2J3B7_THEKT|nr:hypothetical protein RF11_12426 [Thelohanellus kitauei]
MGTKGLRRKLMGLCKQILITSPIYSKNKKRKKKAIICERAEYIVEKPLKLFVNNSVGVSLEAANLLPSYSASKWTIQRKRKRSDVINSRSNTPQEITLPDTLKLTTRFQNFLLYDLGDEYTNRVFMFGTAGNLQLLEEYPQWFLDGTFKIAPEIFIQLFKIHTLIINRAIPSIYVLMGKKG